MLVFVKVLVVIAVIVVLVLVVLWFAHGKPLAVLSVFWFSHLHGCSCSVLLVRLVLTFGLVFAVFPPRLRPVFFVLTIYPGHSTS